MLGATSSSRPAGSWNGSNWPSTFVPRKPSISPTSAPVTREPTAAETPDGVPFFSVTLSKSGPIRTEKLDALAWIQPRRSTTSTGAVPSGASRPVNSRTSGVERVGVLAKLDDRRAGLLGGDVGARPGDP